LRLTATLLFDHPTPAALARLLQTQILGDSETTSVPVFAEIARLEAALSATAVNVNDSTRESITARLQALLQKWTGGHDAPDDSAFAEKLGSASADELMNLINQKLGERVDVNSY
jgi:hypothetical protein